MKVINNAYVRQLKSRRGKPWQGVVKWCDGSMQKTMTRLFDRNDIRTKTQAQLALSSWVQELEDDMAAEDRVPVVSEYVDAYINQLVESQQIEPSTARGYRSSAALIYKAFRDVRIDDLAPAQIQEWEARIIAGGKSASTVGRAHRLLKQVLKHAVNTGDLTSNPMVMVKPPKRRKPSPNSLDHAGRVKVLAMLDGMELTPVVMAAYIALYTGMRQGEICALMWKDVNLANAEINVRRSIGNGEGGCYVKTPKTSSSQRTIPMPSQLVTCLERRLDSMLKEMPYKNSVYNTYVCGTADGKYLNPTVLGRSWATMARNAGLVGTQGRRCTFHDLRHTYATMTIAGGADVKSVASILGHANAAMTLNVYASADTDAMRRTAEIVERAMGEEMPRNGKHFAE